MPIPEEPILFGKYAASIIGPGAAIDWPRLSDQVDYETELVIV